MKASAKAVIASVCAVLVVACSGAAEEDSAQEEMIGGEAPAEAISDEAELDDAAFEVCDGDGNRYPSEADAEAAGLDRAEYGATYCDYLE